MFNIGQKVVCVIGGETSAPNIPTDQPWYWRGDPPVKGRIYTITGFEHNDYWNHDVVRLAEIGNDQGYWVGRFRPIVEKKTDISIFTEILKTGKIKRNKRVKEPV